MHLETPPGARSLWFKSRPGLPEPPGGSKCIVWGCEHSRQCAFSPEAPLRNEAPVQQNSFREDEWGPVMILIMYILALFSDPLRRQCLSFHVKLGQRELARSIHRDIHLLLQDRA